MRDTNDIIFALDCIAGGCEQLDMCCGECPYYEELREKVPDESGRTVLRITAKCNDGLVLRDAAAALVEKPRRGVRMTKTDMELLNLRRRVEAQREEIKRLQAENEKLKGEKT